MKHSGRFGLLVLFLCFITAYSGPASKEENTDPIDTKSDTKNDSDKTKVQDVVKKLEYFQKHCKKFDVEGDTKHEYLQCDPQKEENTDPIDTKSDPKTDSDKTKENTNTKDTKSNPKTDSDKTKENTNTKDTKSNTNIIADFDQGEMCKYTIRISDNEGKCDVKTSGYLQAKGLPVNNGDKEAKGDKGDKWDKGEQAVKLEKCEKGDKGDEGERGERGKTGDKGQNGEKGDEGKLTPYMKYSGTHVLICDGADPPNNLDDERKVINVVCDKNKTESKCLKITPDANTKKYQLPGTDFWLSQAEDFSIAKLYGLQPSKLNYLIEVSDEVSLKMVVHSESKIDLEKSLKILLWDHHLISANSTPQSPTHYEILEDGNDCKGVTETTEWCKATVTLKTLPTLFRDFYFQDLQSQKDQHVKIEIQEVCFTVK